MAALAWGRSPLPREAALQRFLAVAALTAAWYALVWSAPGVGSAFNNLGVARIAVYVAVLAGLWLGLRLTGMARHTQARVWVAVALPLTVWMAAIWTVSVAGVFQPVPGRRVIPLLPVAILLPTIFGTVLLLRSRRITEVLDAMPVHWLVGLQVYRVIGGFFLVNYALGLVPWQFALPAGIGDVAAGLLALPAALYVATGTPQGRRMGLRWNVLGLTDLVFAISLGAMTSPGPLQTMAFDHPNSLVGSYPTVMVPAFAVPLSIMLHILSIWQLRRRERQHVA